MTWVTINISIPTVPGGALGAGFNETGIVQVGKPLGNFYGYVFDGIYQNQAEVNKLSSSTARVGAVKFKDLDGDRKDHDRRPYHHR